jgi:hypothetical protein
MTYLTKKQSRRSPQKQENGMAMVGTMLVLLGITSVVIVGTLKSLSGARVFNGSLSEESHNQLSQSTQVGNRYQAEVLSETGIRLSIQWLVERTTAPTNTSAFSPGSVSSFYGGTESSGWTKITLSQGPSTTQLTNIPQVSGDIYVRFYPFTSNATGSRKMYAIESRGEYMGFVFLSRVFVRQNSFARYAYFSDVCPTSYWVAGLTRFQGPVHVNGVDATGNAVNSAARLNILWKYLDFTPPYKNDWIFTYPDEDYFTTSMSYSQINWQYSYADGAMFYDPNWWYPIWEHITAAKRPPKTDIPIVTMPVANTNQRVAALGGTTAITTTGIQVPGTAAPSAGIYINGDVRDMNLTTSGSNNTTQIIDVKQYDTTNQQDRWTVITMNPVADTTQVHVRTRSNTTAAWNISDTTGFATDSVTNYSGVPNGVIYVNGSIGEQTGSLRGGLTGAVANSITDTDGNVTRQWGMTIATEQTMGVNINGGIVYQTLISNSTNPDNLLSTAASASAACGMMGLVAGNIRVTDSDDGGTPLTNVSVHAICMAYGTFNATNPSTRPAGVFSLIGGYIVKNNGTFGSALPNGTVENGFLTNRNYDQRVMDTPPPAFPAVEKQFQILSYQRAITSLD